LKICSLVAQINSIKKKEFTPEVFKNLLKEKIAKTDINLIKNDVLPFLKNPQEIEIWSTEYFLQLVEMVKFFY
jgi:hypothetical protein